jgi:hypothetical protein
MKKIHWKKLGLVFLFVVGVGTGLFVVARPSFAASDTWTGNGGDNKFSTGANWGSGVAPTNGDSLTFDVSILSADQTLTNDISGLSVSGIHFTGTFNTNHYTYALRGNDLTVSGTLLDDTVPETGDNVYSDYMYSQSLNAGINISLASDVIDNSVWVKNVAMNGHKLTLQGRIFPPYSDDGVMLGAVTGSGTIEVAQNSAFMIDAGTSFTGAITVDSGATLNTLSSVLTSASSVTINNGTLALQQILGSQQIASPISISGTLTTTSNMNTNNGGDNFGEDPANNTVTFSGGFQLNGDLTYKSGSVHGGAGYGHLNNATVTTPYASHGHTLTIDPDSEGTLNVPGDTVPAAPTGLNGTPASGQVALSWTAPTSDGGSPITDYQVQYKLSSDSTWTTFNDGTSTTTSATVTGLTNGNSYDFRVAAVNHVGNGAYATITNISLASAATAPNNLTATPGDSEAGLAWDAPTSDGGSAITDYQIQYKLASDSTWTTFNDGTSTTTSAVVTGLTNGNSYDFRVAAINGLGTGPYSTVTGVAVAAPIVAPSAPRNLAATPASTQAALNWDAPTSNGGAIITDYQVQYKLSSDSTWTTFNDGTSTATSATVTGLSNGNNYDFRVAAINSAGTGSYVVVTGIAVAAAATTPGAISNLASVPGDTQVALSWSAPASNGGSPITDYAIQYKLSSDSTWTTFNDGTSTATNATVTGLTNGVSYDFSVAAVNSVGTGTAVTTSATGTSGTGGNGGNGGGGGGGNTTPTGGTTTATAPTAPVGVVDSITGGLTLNWTNPSSDGGAPITDYLIEDRVTGTIPWSTLSHPAITASPYTVTSGLVANQTYDFRISAINSAGTGPSVVLSNYTYTVPAPTGTVKSDGKGGVKAPNTAFLGIPNSPVVFVGLGVVTSAILLVYIIKSNVSRVRREN